MTEEIRNKIDALPCKYLKNGWILNGMPHTDEYLLKGHVISLVEELTRWNKCEDCLPKVIHTSTGCWENEELLLVKIKQFDSIEFGVFTELDGHSYFDCPDSGNYEIEEITEWKYIN